MKLVHIIAGLSGLISGAVTLYAFKGGKLHRRSGVIFVGVMLVMSASGAALAAVKPDRISVVAGLLTFYLVSTALLTVRRPVQKFNWVDAAATLLGISTAILGTKFGVEALYSPTGTLDGLPPVPVFIFAAVALMAVIGDIRMRISLNIDGTHRIARHLWRMCFALWIAVGSFFLGQAQVFPKAIRIMPLLATPVILVMVLMFYWLARVLFKNKKQKIIKV